MASNSDPSLVHPSVVAKLLPKKDGLIGKVKIKKPAAVPAKSKSETIEPNPNGKARSISPDSPLINEIDSDLRATFPTGRPMEDKAELIQCKHCKKPMLKSVAASHIKLCLQKKLDRAQKKKEQKEASRKAREAREKGKDEDGDAIMDDSVVVATRPTAGDGDSTNGDQNIKTAKKSAPGGTGGDKSKKRKADTEGDKDPKKKKTKKEIEAAKPKVPKPKGPVDVEKQCGVLLPNGGSCARSLTCKSHAMGAKRAVPGRSLRYDLLLSAYQKKNQAKQQKAAIEATAPLADDLEPSGPVDSDEEKDLVMASIARSRPRPLEQHVFVPLRKKYAYVRMKEMLANALGGSRSITGVGGMGTSGMVNTPTFIGGSSSLMANGASETETGDINAPGSGHVNGGEVFRKGSIAKMEQPQSGVRTVAPGAGVTGGIGIPARKASGVVVTAAG